MIALVVGACGGDDDNATDSGKRVGGRAEARVNVRRRRMWTTRRQHSRTPATEFCSSSKALIDVLDRYGQILDQDAVTVGDVKTGAADLKQTRTDVGADAARRSRRTISWSPPTRN